MGEFSQRMKNLIGADNHAVLESAKVAVYGLGGVGAACAMDLVRAGIGSLYVVDFDTVDQTNLNRLYFGYQTTVGLSKVQVFKRFAKDVNPEVAIEGVERFFQPEEAQDILGQDAWIHADCIDSLASKTSLIATLLKNGKVFVSSMGTAGRLDPCRIKIGSFWKIQGCPLARRIRYNLRSMGISEDFPALWSDEEAIKPQVARDPSSGGRKYIQCSSPFVPQAAGHCLAAWIVRQILSRR
ncbi:MAG: dinucleotide-utilizing enzyme [Spirochaetes bacterium]|nr:MAG: dinucleotide-utilizing enzyme [Spirochaetota bacterium]